MEEIKRAFQALVLATVGLFVAVCVLGVFGYVSLQHRSQEIQQLARQNQQLIKQGVEAHLAECILKDDLRKRIHTSQIELSSLELYQSKHPDGTSQISKTDVETAIKVKQDLLSGQKRTLQSLSVVKCD